MAVNVKMKRSPYGKWWLTGDRYKGVFMGPGNACGFLSVVVMRVNGYVKCILKSLCPLGKFCRVVGKMMLIPLFPSKSFYTFSFSILCLIHVELIFA